MKRNKHNNVVKTVENAKPHSEKLAAERESTELVMKGADGNLIKAEGVVLNPNFIALSQRLMKEKGVSKESAEAIAKSCTVWTPDMVGKDIDAEAPAQEAPKKKAVRKKKVADEKPKTAKKTTRKSKKTEEVPVEEKPKKKVTRKKKAADTNE